MPFYLPPDAKDLAGTFGRAEDHEVTTGLFFSQRIGKVAPMGLLTKRLGGDFRSAVSFGEIAPPRPLESEEVAQVGGNSEDQTPPPKTTTLKRLQTAPTAGAHKNSGLNSFLRKLLL